MMIMCGETGVGCGPRLPGGDGGVLARVVVGRAGTAVGLQCDSRYAAGMKTLLLN